MFLHTILYMIILQTTFLHVYHLKDDIRFCLNGSPNSHVYAYALQRRSCLWLLPTCARAPVLYIMGGRQRLLEQTCLRLCFPEMALSLVSPYTCTSASPLRYAWSV